jgi:glycosyltransferase involved in cell wall biosynthesis
MPELTKPTIINEAPRRLALFYLAHDGITSYYTGVGTYTKCYRETLPLAIRQASEAGYDVSLFLVTIYSNPDYCGASPETAAESRTLCRELNGRVIELDNGLDGSNTYGSVPHWDAASRQAADVVADALKVFDSAVVVAVDTPFLKVAEFLNARLSPADRARVTVCLSPQSTETIHKTGIPRRYEWEHAALRACTDWANTSVSYSSLYLRDDLAGGYQVPHERLIPSINGLSFTAERHRRYSQDYIGSRLAQGGLPTDRPIVVSVGRLERYKGFQEAIRLFSLIPKRHRPYLVLIGVSYIDDNPLLHELEAEKDRLGIDGTFIFHFDAVLPVLLWQWHHCVLSVHLSLYEPFGLAPTEARYLARDHGPVVVVSDRGGFREQVTDGNEGFMVRYGDTDDYRRVVATVFEEADFDGAAMRLRAHANVVANYDCRRNIAEFLAYLHPAFRPTHGGDALIAVDMDRKDEWPDCPA